MECSRLSIVIRAVSVALIVGLGWQLAAPGVLVAGGGDACVDAGVHSGCLTTTSFDSEKKCGSPGPSCQDCHWDSNEEARCELGSKVQKGYHEEPDSSQW